MTYGLIGTYNLPEALKGTILERIMEVKLRRIAEAAKKYPTDSIEMVLDRSPETRSLKEALLSCSPAIIAELKRATPSAGILRPDFDHLEIAKELEQSGAAALSIITEVEHFRGSLEFLASVRWQAKVPLLRKDFVVDPYQILEARHAGADAVLLIAALSDTQILRRLREEVERLGMEALVEVHNEAELDRALEAGAAIIGINNRDLRSFQTSLDVCLGLASRLPKGIIAVAESGIRNHDDIRRLSEAGYCGFLIGEPLMRAASAGGALRELLGTHLSTRKTSGPRIHR